MLPKRQTRNQAIYKKKRERDRKRKSEKQRRTEKHGVLQPGHGADAIRLRAPLLLGLLLALRTKQVGGRVRAVAAGELFELRAGGTRQVVGMAVHNEGVNIASNNFSIAFWTTVKCR